MRKKSLFSSMPPKTKCSRSAFAIFSRTRSALDGVQICSRIRFEAVWVYNHANGKAANEDVSHIQLSELNVTFNGRDA